MSQKVTITLDVGEETTPRLEAYLDAAETYFADLGVPPAVLAHPAMEMAVNILASVALFTAQSSMEKPC